MKQNQSSSSFSAIFAWIVIGLSFVVSTAIYTLVLGNANNFVNKDVNNHPVDTGIEKWFGTVHKGGVIVPVLMGLLIIVITFSFERIITIMKAKGKGTVSDFVRSIKNKLDGNQVDEAIKICNDQKGSVANVMLAGLLKYKEMQSETHLPKEQRVAAIQKEVEEATSLELPMLEKNLVVLSTITSVATLVGLLGTVIGMIKAFAALANSGAPDATALSTGISEALINTALGIGASALAIVMYNVFTTQIDKLTYGIDESGYTITQTFAAKNS